VSDLFSTEKMQKIRIVALQNRKYEIIRELHKKGAIDIRKSSLAVADDSIVEFPVLSELLIRYKSAEAILKRYVDKKLLKKHTAPQKQLERDQLITKAQSLWVVQDVFALNDRKNEISGEMDEIKEARELARNFVGMGIDFSKLKSDALAFRAFSVLKNARKKVYSEMAKLKGDYEIMDTKTKSSVTLFIAYKKGNEAPLGTFASLRGISEIDIDNRYLDATAEEVLARLDRSCKKLKHEKVEIDEMLKKHAAESYLKVAAVIEMLSVESERAEVSMNFKKTGSTFIVEGWVLKRNVEPLRKDLLRLTDGKLILDLLETDELAPTLTNRPEFLRPFDFVVSFVSLPRSDEIDPTWIFILTFPILYGLMISDVGYGIMSFLLATLLIKISDPDGLLSNASKIWRISAFSIIVFGFLSNQYFGLQLNQYFTTFTGFDWIKDLTTILGACILFGIAHIVIGLALGFVNKYRHGHMKLAISKLSSIVLVISGTVAIAGMFFGVFDPGIASLALYVAIASAIVTFVASGIEATEMASLIAHPLSYARLLGFGLGSVIIAMIINMFFTPSLSSGVLGFSLTLVIFILLHFFNMIIGIFEGIIQAVRLNVVEFFSKFYEGNGIRFSPFYYKRRYTKEE